MSTSRGEVRPGSRVSATVRGALRSTFRHVAPGARGYAAVTAGAPVNIGETTPPTSYGFGLGPFGGPGAPFGGTP